MMETLRLKSRVGPTKLRCGNVLSNSRTPDWVANFSLDNDCTAEVPSEWWEHVNDQFFDRKLNLRYREAFQPR